MSKSNEKLVQNTLKILERDFIVVGKTRVRSWHAWLAIGLAAGAVASILFVANRSGEFEAGMAATRPVPKMGGWAKNIHTVMSFEVPSATEWGFGRLGDFRPNVFVQLEERDLKLAMEAMRMYDAEMRPAPHPRSEAVLRARAVRWGSYAGVGLAEAFQLVRAVV